MMSARGVFCVLLGTKRFWLFVLYERWMALEAVFERVLRRDKD